METPDLLILKKPPGFETKYRRKQLNEAPEHKERKQLDLLLCIIKSNESKQVRGELPRG